MFNFFLTQSRRNKTRQQIGVLSLVKVNFLMVFLQMRIMGLMTEEKNKE